MIFCMNVDNLVNNEHIYIRRTISFNKEIYDKLIIIFLYKRQNGR